MRNRTEVDIGVAVLLVAALLVDIFITPGESLAAAPYVVAIAIAAYLVGSRQMILVGAFAVLLQAGVGIFFHHLPPLIATGAILTIIIVALLSVVITRKTERELLLQRNADAFERERAVAEEREAKLGIIQQQNEELVVQQEELAAQNDELQREIADRKQSGEERERLLSELADQNSVVESIVQTMPATVGLTLGPDHLIRYANPQYQAIKPGVEMVGRRIRDVWPELEEQGFYDILDQVYRTGEAFDLPEQEVEFEAEGARKKTFWNIRYAPVKSSQGRTIGILHFGINITGQVAARKTAEEAVKARDEFLSIASHELKTPLTSLAGFTQLLTEAIDKTGGVEPARLRHVAGIINDQSNRLANLVNRLLDVSRLEAGKLVLEPKRLDIGMLVQGVVQNAQIRADGYRIQLDARSGIEVTADQMRLEQVVTNLLDNAVKYSPQGGDIEVGVKAEDSNVVKISVRDHGIGIPPERRADLFSRFYQAHQAGYSGGMGLGLYISKQIVELHGGTIEAQFPADGGTCMLVTLPGG